MMNIAMQKRGMDTYMRLSNGCCDILNMSATMRRAERNAVSPDVMAHAMTPKMTKAAMVLPSVVSEMMFTSVAALPLCSIIALLRPSTPPQNAMAMDAQMSATMLSAIMAP